MIQWQIKRFAELDALTLYQLLKLRVDIFVVEQSCPYPELDNKDLLNGVHHLLGYQNEELIACSRLLPSGISYPDVSIGRVATKREARGGGLGHQLMEQSIIHCQQLWPDCVIEIGAQAYLKDFYQQHGFVATSDIYLEDGIAHLDMKRA